MTEPEQKLQDQSPSQPLRQGFSGLSKILVPTDFSATSELALAYALALARRFNAHIYLMHVLTNVDDLGRADHSSSAYQSQRQAAERSVEKILESRQLRNVPHDVLIEDGYLLPTIERFVRGICVDLIAVGTHGGPSSGQFLGSSAEIIFRNVDCPVLTVGPCCPKQSAASPAPPLPHDPPFQHILFATDFGRAAQYATAYAIGLAQAFHSSLTLLHVVTDVPSNDTDAAILRETSRIRLLESVPEQISPPVKIDNQVAFGDGPEQILRAAKARNADLIVMGARAGQTLVTHHLPETSAYTVASGSICPLMTVRR